GNSSLKNGGKLRARDVPARPLAAPSRPGATAAAPQPALEEPRLRGVVCPTCGAHAAAGLKFCEMCGTALTAEKRHSGVLTGVEAPSRRGKTAIIAIGISVVVLLAPAAA